MKYQNLVFVRYSTTPTSSGFLGIGRRGQVFIFSWSTAPGGSCLTGSVNISHIFINRPFCTSFNTHSVYLGFFFGLFSFILEPDVGMPEKDAHRFFQQLIAAVVSGLNVCKYCFPTPVFASYSFSCSSTGVPPQSWHHPQRHKAWEYFAGR